MTRRIIGGVLIFLGGIFFLISFLTFIHHVSGGVGGSGERMFWDLFWSVISAGLVVLGIFLVRGKARA